jgi:hypothetical protein
VAPQALSLRIDQALGPHWQGFASWQPHWQAPFAAAGLWQPQVQAAPTQSAQVQAALVSVFMVVISGGEGRPRLACG